MNEPINYDLPPCENCICLAICKSRVQDGSLISFLCLGDMCQPMRLFVFPQDRPIITANQGATIDQTNSMEHLDKCIELLKPSLLKGIELDNGI